MKKLFGIITALFLLLLVTVPLFSPKTAFAADIRTGKTVILSGTQSLKNPYLFGGTVEVNSPVTNDAVIAGGNINLTGTISNDLLAAGGTILVRGKIGNTARIAGGNITIESPVTNDLVLAGGNVTLTKNASIGEDVLMAGGQLDIEGPVKGKILIGGGNITLNSTVGGDVTVGHAGTLTLGPQAKINGNLTYSSEQMLTKNPGSVVLGQTTYHHVEKQQNKQQSKKALIGFGIYGLLVEILLSILLISIARNGVLATLLRIRETPWQSLGIGLIYVLLAPVASLILLILFPLGIASALFYLLVLILSIFVRDIFAGWLIMRGFDNRRNKAYILDWKAGVIGPIVFFIINLIPVLGWLLSAVVCLMGIGALLANLMRLMPQLQTLPKKR